MGSCARTSSASRRSVPTVVCVTTGACACVVSAPRRPAARAAPSVCPRRRARYLRLRCYYDMLPQRAGGTVRAVYAFLASACAVGLQDILTPPDLSLHKTVPTVFYSFSLSDKLD